MARLNTRNRAATARRPGGRPARHHHAERPVRRPLRRAAERRRTL